MSPTASRHPARPVGATDVTQADRVSPRERFRAGLRYGLLALLLFAPLPFGSVQPGAVLAIELSAALLGAGSILLLATEREPATPLTRALISLGGLLLAIAMFQLVPLPVSWVAAVAGPTAEARLAVGAVVPEVVTTPMPISLSPPDTVSALLRLGAYLLVALTAVVTLRERRHLTLAVAVLVAGGTFQALYGSFEYLSGRQQIFGYVKKHYLGDATGTFINRNHYAAYLAMTLPFALGLMATTRRTASGGPWRERALALTRPDVVRRWVGSCAVFCIWIGVALSYSRAGLAAALLATVTVAAMMRTRKRWFVALLLAALAAPTVFLMVQDVRAPGERLAFLGRDLSATSGRPTVWLATARIVADYPLLGTGLGTFESAFPAYRPSSIRTHWDHAHNDWLQSAAGGGVLVPLVFAIFCFLLLRPRHRRDSLPSDLRIALACSSAGIAAIAFHSLVDFGLRIPAVAVLLAFLVGFRIAADRLADRARVDFGPRLA